MPLANRLDRLHYTTTHTQILIRMPSNHKRTHTIIVKKHFKIVKRCTKLGNTGIPLTLYQNGGGEPIEGMPGTTDQGPRAKFQA